MQVSYLSRTQKAFFFAGLAAVAACLCATVLIPALVFFPRHLPPCLGKKKQARSTTGYDPIITQHHLQNTQQSTTLHIQGVVCGSVVASPLLLLLGWLLLASKPVQTRLVTPALEKALDVPAMKRLLTLD